MQESFWWRQCSNRYIISLFPHLHIPPPFSLSLISLMVSVDVKHHVYFWVLKFPWKCRPTAAGHGKRRRELVREGVRVGGWRAKICEKTNEETRHLTTRLICHRISPQKIVMRHKHSSYDIWYSSVWQVQARFLAVTFFSPFFFFLFLSFFLFTLAMFCIPNNYCPPVKVYYCKHLRVVVFIFCFPSGPC